MIQQVQNKDALLSKQEENRKSSISLIQWFWKSVQGMMISMETWRPKQHFPLCGYRTVPSLCFIEYSGFKDSLVILSVTHTHDQMDWFNHILLKSLFGLERRWQQHQCFNGSHTVLLQTWDQDENIGWQHLILFSRNKLWRNKVLTAQTEEALQWGLPGSGVIKCALLPQEIEKERRKEENPREGDKFSKAGVIITRWRKHNVDGIF